VTLIPWHREFAAHRRTDGPGQTHRHSHCPGCGLEVGEATTSCARCGATFRPSPIAFTTEQERPSNALGLP
jgi:hypothetical protein